MDKKKHTFHVRMNTLIILLAGLSVLASLFAMWFTQQWLVWQYWLPLVMNLGLAGTAVWSRELTRRQYRRDNPSD
jgi:site-specific recombinase